MQKLIVMSATYRQSSKVSPELLQRDPDNRLACPWAAAPAGRGDGSRSGVVCGGTAGRETRRTVCEAVPARRVCGKSRRCRTWIIARAKGRICTGAACTPSGSEPFPPPMMTNFDAAGREACIVRETRTNTPLQALNLMNDVTFIEAARFIGQRMMKEGGSDTRAAPAAWISTRASHATRTKPNSAFCRETSIITAITSHLTRRKRRGSLERGRLPRRSGAEPSGTGRLCVGRELDAESRRGDHDPMSLDPITERKLLITRRHFFGRTRTGIGTAALASLLGKESARRTALPGLPHFRAKSQARHLLVPARRAVAAGSVRLQARR